LIDTLIGRYQKCCRKLHQSHNDYVLLLCEASEYERDVRTVLLPGLLEHQQAIQEDMIDKWKIALQEVRSVYCIIYFLFLLHSLHSYDYVQWRVSLSFLASLATRVPITSHLPH